MANDGFAPKTTFNVDFERPVAPVENRAPEMAIRSIANIFDAASEARNAQKPTFNDQLNAQYLEQIDKIKQLEDQGQYTRASMMRTRLDSNFVGQGGDLADTSLRAAVKARTGYELDDFAVDPVDQHNAYLDSHNDAPMVYNNLVAGGMDPDMAREETRRALSDQLQDRHTLAQAQDRDPAWWERRGRHAFDSNLDYSVEQISGLVAQGITSGGQLDSSAMAQLRTAWEAEKAQTMASLPTYLNDAQRQAVEDKLKAVDSQISSLESVASNDALMSVLKDRIANRGDRTHSQVMAEVLSELEAKGTALSVITGGNTANAKLFIETVLEASAEANGITIDRDFLEALADPDRTLVSGLQVAPEEQRDSLYPNYNPESRDVAIQDAETLARSGHAIQTHELVNRDVAASYGDSILGMATALYNLGSNGEVTSPASIKRIIGDPSTFADKMAALAESHPDVYAQVAPQLATSLANLSTVADTAITSWMQNGKVAGANLDLVYDERTKTHYVTGQTALIAIRAKSERDYQAAYVEGKGLAYRDGDAWAEKDFFDLISSKRTVDHAMTRFGIDNPSAQPDVTLRAPYSVFLDEIDRTEGGGDYDALLNFSNRRGAFAGTRVSEMTIGELLEFSGGSYAEYSRSQLGYKATPMGRYQFVGTTLKSVAEQMGLSEDTVFSPAVQDKMFGFYVGQVLSEQATISGKMAAIRRTWAGFRNTSDRELRELITEYEAGAKIWDEEQTVAAEVATELDYAFVAHESEADNPFPEIAPVVMTAAPSLGEASEETDVGFEGGSPFGGKPSSFTPSSPAFPLIDPETVPGYDPESPVYDFSFSEGEIPTDDMEDGSYVVDLEKNEVYTVQDGILDVADEDVAQVVLQEHVGTKSEPQTSGGGSEPQTSGGGSEPFNGQDLATEDMELEEAVSPDKAMQRRMQNMIEFQASPQTRRLVEKLVSDRQKAMLRDAGIELKDVFYIPNLTIAEGMVDLEFLPKGTVYVISTGQVYAVTD